MLGLQSQRPLSSPLSNVTADVRLCDRLEQSALRARETRAPALEPRRAATPRPGLCAGPASLTNLFLGPSRTPLAELSNLSQVARESAAVCQMMFDEGGRLKWTTARTLTVDRGRLRRSRRNLSSGHLRLRPARAINSVGVCCACTNLTRPPHLDSPVLFVAELAPSPLGPSIHLARSSSARAHDWRQSVRPEMGHINLERSSSRRSDALGGAQRASERERAPKLFRCPFHSLSRTSRLVSVSN